MKLFKVLRAVANYDKAIGYVQGFNFIVGNLLKLIDNAEHTFWLFIGLLYEYKLTDIYTENMS